MGILRILLLELMCIVAAGVPSGKLVFRPLMHQPRIYSGAPSGVHVTTVHAYDPDKPRKKVEYNIPNVLDYRYFVVDLVSGNLTTASPINKTVGESLQVMVAAVSHGSSELEHLQIAVTEFNQFAPRFEQRSFELELHPKTAVNSTVLQVKATDPDPAPHNAEIYYKMDQNLTSNYFYLDALTGDLILIQPINETQKSLHFGIFAEDGGSPKRWDYLPVNIMLKNISAPSNVTIIYETDKTAIVCWEEPIYGDVFGYGVRYSTKHDVVPHVVNVTIDYDTDTCLTLIGLKDDSEYMVQVFGWNEEEMGQISHPVKFRTRQNWCRSSPCNSGTCDTLEIEPWFVCYCPSGHYGPLCEFYDPCSTNPCGNNGRCRNTTHNEYVCICDEDYNGPNCGSYNPCLRNPNPCNNGGTCEMTTNNTYVCICAPGFFGRKCKLRDLCFSNPCFNAATCELTSNDTIRCLCPPHFTGLLCESEVDYCAEEPCSVGSTCVNRLGSYSCICPPGYFGNICNITSQCSPDKTDTEKGMFYWNATDHSSVVVIKCPFGSVNSIGEGLATRRCLLLNGSTEWEAVDTSECKAKNIVVADELAEELYNITMDPLAVNSETLEAAAQGIETIATYATKDKKLAQGMVNIISKVMDVNDTIIELDEEGTLADNLLQSIDDFASNVELKPGESFSIYAENVRIQSMEWHPDVETEIEEEHLEFSAPSEKGVIEEPQEENKNTEILPPSSSSNDTVVTTPPPEKDKVPMLQIFVPKEALQEAHRQLDRSFRVTFVVFYNDKLFQSKKPAGSQHETKAKNNISNEVEGRSEPAMKTPVLQISVGNVSLTNMYKPLIYILPMSTKRKAFCVYWNEIERKWSTNGLTTNQTSDKVICESSHMTAFSVLLDLTPEDKPSEKHITILSYISYVGCYLSIIGLTLTILTYCLFGCLNRDHPGKILLNLCFSLLLMNSAFVIGCATNSQSHACAFTAMFIHYSVLTSLSWMCVEAVNMYQLLIHVFATSETRFLTKRCLLAWGVPLLIVTSTALFRIRAYYNESDFCILTPRNPWIYYGAFFSPACLLLGINFVVFILVSRVIFTPRLTARASPKPHPKVTTAQVRGAFTVMVLLGVTWVLGPIAVGKSKLIFQYLFCISNSAQGFLIFVVRCIMYPEARKAWSHLFQTGKLKRHRGIVPPGTISFSSNSGGKNASSPNATVRTESTEDSGSASFDNNGFNGTKHKCKIGNASPTQMAIKVKTGDVKPNGRRVGKAQKAKDHSGSMFRNEKNNVSCNMVNHRNEKCDNIEMKKKPDKNSKNAPNVLQWQPPLHYITEIIPPVSPYPFRHEKYSKESEIEYNNAALRISPSPDRKKKLVLPTNVLGLSPNITDLRKDRRSASLGVSRSSNGREECIYYEPDSPYIEELKSFFTSLSLHSPEPILKDKRSMSLDVNSSTTRPTFATCISVVKGKKETKNAKLKIRNSIVMEENEENSDDDSSLTDIDDSPEISSNFKRQANVANSIQVDINPHASPRFPECLRRTPTFGPMEG